jgi:hypothetical protein
MDKLQDPEAAETARIKDSPAVVSAATCSPIADRYGWMESNRLKAFASWEDEIAHATAEGYQVVPPDYHIPHWSTAMSMGDALPKLYVMRMAGNFDELRASFDRPARDIAYPLFFRVNAESIHPESKPNDHE